MKKVLVLGGGAQGRTLAEGLQGAFVDDAALMAKSTADAALSATGFDVVLIPAAFAEVLAPAPIAGMDEGRWKALAEDPLLRVRTALQCASERVRAPGGAVFMIVPTIGIVGIAQLAAQSMATEGARCIAKSASRVWIKRGITVNTIAVSVNQISGETDAFARPALAEIGALALTLADGRAATGNTIYADGELTSV